MTHVLGMYRGQTPSLPKKKLHEGGSSTTTLTQLASICMRHGTEIKRLIVCTLMCLLLELVPQVYGSPNTTHSKRKEEGEEKHQRGREIKHHVVTMITTNAGHHGSYIRPMCLAPISSRLIRLHEPCMHACLDARHRACTAGHAHIYYQEVPPPIMPFQNPGAVSCPAWLPVPPSQIGRAHV